MSLLLMPLATRSARPNTCRPCCGWKLEGSAGLRLSGEVDKSNIAELSAALESAFRDDRNFQVHLAGNHCHHGRYHLRIAYDVRPPSFYDNRYGPNGSHYFRVDRLDEKRITLAAYRLTQCRVGLCKYG
jgi:hypothetical protein